MRRWCWLVLLFVWVPAVWAAEPEPNDFAFGNRIAVPPGTAVAALSLPRQVYRALTRPDLGDMRVFNAEGQPVPHLIRHASSQPADAPWQPLAFFPVPETVDVVRGGYRVYVRTEADGAVVRVDPGDPRSPLPSGKTVIVDQNAEGRNLAQLRLRWQPAAEIPMVTVVVDASDDLVHWTPIVPKAVISDMRHGGHRLRRDTISFSPVQRRYLRLRQINAGRGIVLTAVEGRRAPEGRRPVRAFVTAYGTPVDGKAGTFFYRFDGRFPVDRIDLHFDQANSMAEATLESRSDARSPWVRRCRALFYRIDVDGMQLTGGPQPVALTMDPEWRLSVDASESTIGNGVPRLEAGYRPHDLYFIARGRGPFTVAYGSAAVAPLPVNVAALFAGIRQQRGEGIERWVKPVGGRIVLGGAERLKPLPKPLPTRRIVLWSILVAGVLILAVMAWHLARRMKP